LVGCQGGEALFEEVYFKFQVKVFVFEVADVLYKRVVWRRLVLFNANDKISEHQDDTFSCSRRVSVDPLPPAILERVRFERGPGVLADGVAPISPNIFSLPGVSKKSSRSSSKTISLLLLLCRIWEDEGVSCATDGVLRGADDCAVVCDVVEGMRRGVFPGWGRAGVIMDMPEASEPREKSGMVPRDWLETSA
jgi:hypothetical protein